MWQGWAVSDLGTGWVSVSFLIRVTFFSLISYHSVVIAPLCGEGKQKLQGLLRLRFRNHRESQGQPLVTDGKLTPCPGGTSPQGP